MNRRKNYFIKKDFQTRFFTKFVLLLFLEAVFIAALFMAVSRGTLVTAYKATGLTIQETSLYFLSDFLLITLIAAAGIGIAGVFVFMYLTHSLAGPLYKFEQVLEGAKQGDMAQRMKLRSTDQLKDLETRMNQFLREDDTRISGIKGGVKHVLDLAGKARAADAGKIKELLEQIKSSLDHFKTS